MFYSLRLHYGLLYRCFLPLSSFPQLQSGWAGYYDFNTFDQNAIIGCHPCIRNLVLVNGFSGHGIQQSPAVGRAVSEIVLDGQTHSIDLRDFSFERVINGTPLREKNII